ncbi:MAG: type IX secretion system membrane protein PorP/SprF [Cytophagales bacterium]|nr:type IX secretion system membrane protein PorP/SprF [Cytophagales bacterium]
MKHKRQQAKVSFGIRPLRQLAGKALLGFFGCMHVLITAEAQQVPDYNLYTLDASLLNPAAVGLQDYSHVHLLYRKQWVGLTGTPEIARLSIQGPLPNRPMGLGGFVLSDSYHLLQKNVAGLQYAYRIDLAQESHLRMGLQASLAQHLFRFDKVVAESPGDEVLFQYPEQNNAFDLAVGLLYQRRKWTLGFSSLQLLQNDLTLLSQENKKELRYKLVRHFNLSASYKFHLPDPRISLEPSLLLRNVQGLPATLDMNVQALFEDRLWAGLSYRNLSSVAVHFGMLASERFGFTYAFEHGFNELSYASNGSHELRLSYRLASTSAAGGASYARRDVESLSRQTTEQYE